MYKYTIAYITSLYVPPTYVDVTNIVLPLFVMYYTCIQNEGRTLHKLY